MKIYITGLPSGYEVEHLVRLFYPMAPLTLTPPEAGEDCVWAEKKPDGLWAMVRQGGKCAERTAPLPAPAEAGGETPEFSLASLTYDLLRQWTGIRPPWGKMTGVRPVRLIHDKRAAGWSETDIDHFFLERFDCSEQKYQMAKAIADLQEPILKVGSAPKTYSLYIGIPFCPSRCSYCSFVSCNLDRDRKMVQPYVDCLCNEVEEIRRQADKAGLTLCSIYIGGGTPTSLSADQLRQLMGTVRQNFDLSKVVEYTVEAGRPDCTDAEKLAVIKEYGATRISINPQTFSDEVLAGIGRKHSAQDILDCYAEARKAGHDDINMDLIAGLPRDSYEGFCRTLDGVLAMEGDGPGASGTPRHAGVLLVSDSPLALDAAAAALIGLPLASNPVLLAAQRRGLRPSYIEEVELLGEPLEALRMDDYRFPSRIKGNLMEFLGPLAGPAGKLCKRVLSQTPKIRTDACVGCGICKSACPGKAISMDGPGGKARIDPRACIHCYCCHELCPQKAVALRQNWLGRYLK